MGFFNGDAVLVSYNCQTTAGVVIHSAGLKLGVKIQTIGGEKVIEVSRNAARHATISQMKREGVIPPARPLVNWIDPATGETFRTFADDTEARAAGCHPVG